MKQMLQTIMLHDPSSRRKAWYRLSLYQLSEGYIVEKVSGAENSKGTLEAWFRENRADAEIMFKRILESKTKVKPNSPRTYIERPPERPEQEELFSVNQ